MRLIFLSLLVLLSIGEIDAQIDEIKVVNDEYKPYLYASSEDLEWFINAKFGAFVHWGPYALAEVPASWGRFGPRPFAGKQANSGVPELEYDNLYKNFNPINFNADEWIKMVKQSGAKYFIFTTKHHDGFCMFDAHNTDYKITNTPFGRDIAKEIADACHKYEIKLFWYYSQPDWHHPDCKTENHERYKEYMYEHLEQLCTEYGKIDCLWFDNLGAEWTDWDTPKMVKLIREWQPGILINRRWGHGMPGISHQGDFETPEQQIGVFKIDHPWETCATIAEAWSWTGAKKVKTYRTNQRLLIQCAGSGGNLALNTGPTPGGLIHPPEKEIYLKIGKWLENYGESIYNTKGGPYKPGPWGVSSCHYNKIYLHILCEFATNTVARVVLPELPNSIVSAKLLTSDKKVRISNMDGNLEIVLPEEGLNTLDNIVELTIQGNAEDILPIETVDDKKIIHVQTGDASSSSNEKNSPKAMFVEGEGDFDQGIKHKTWWAPEKSDKDLWLSVEFEKEHVINYVSLAEQIRNCAIRKFIIESESDGKWIELYEGTEIGMDFSVQFPETKTKKLRLRVLKMADDDVPNISKFNAFNL